MSTVSKWERNHFYKYLELCNATIKKSINSTDSSSGDYIGQTPRFISLVFCIN